MVSTNECGSAYAIFNAIFGVLRIVGSITTGELLLADTTARQGTRRFCALFVAVPIPIPTGHAQTRARSYNTLQGHPKCRYTRATATNSAPSPSRGILTRILSTARA